MAKAAADDERLHKSDAWTDLALTLPIFIVYHLGVVFLPIRNAADPVTRELKGLANQSLVTYAGLTLLFGVVFVVVLATLGQGKALHGKRFALIAIEGTLYAVLMRFAGAFAIGSLPLGPKDASGAGGESLSVFAGTVMSLGAGFYEEIAFRVGLFGLGALLLRVVVRTNVKRWVFTALWAVAAAVVFSAWHYVGQFGDPWNLKTFVFRAVCGLFLTIIYAFRGFAPAVWTHALYDVWALVLH